MIPTKSYKVLIASPNDVDRERRILRRAIDNVNDHLKMLEHPCRLELYSWKDDTYPDAGIPEKNLLSQIPIEGADIFIAIFWKRFGTVTGDFSMDGEPFLSGTEEEIEKALEIRKRTGKPIIMMFRKLDRIPPDLSDPDIEQLRLVSRYLNQFKNAGEQGGLIVGFKSVEFSDRLTKALFKAIADISVKGQGISTKKAEPAIKIEYTTTELPNPKTRNQILLEVVRKSILDSEKTGPQVINFWGGRGIGKTTLLGKVLELEESKDFQILGPWNTTDIQDQKLFDLMISKISLRTSQKTIALFDNVDAALDQKESFLDLEKAIRALLDTNSIVVVTSRYKIRQWSKDIKFHQREFRIPLLTTLEVSQLMQNNNITDEFAYTFGYPQVMTWLLNEKINEKSISQKATEYFMEDLPPESKELLFLTSLLPVFNPGALDRISENAGGQSITYGKYGDMLNIFEKKGLIYWDENWGLYRFANSATRRLIARHHLYKDPANYRKIHRLAAEYFADETKRRNYFPYFFVSAAYHLLMMYDDKNFARKITLEWLDDHLQPWIAFDKKSVFDAWESGGGEPDVKLEIQETISTNSYLDILQRLDTARKAAEV